MLPPNFQDRKVHIRKLADHDWGIINRHVVTHRPSFDEALTFYLYMEARAKETAFLAKFIFPTTFVASSNQIKEGV